MHARHPEYEAPSRETLQIVLRGGTLSMHSNPPYHVRCLCDLSKLKPSRNSRTMLGDAAAGSARQRLDGPSWAPWHPIRASQYSGDARSPDAGLGRLIGWLDSALGCGHVGQSSNWKVPMMGQIVPQARTPGGRGLLLLFAFLK